MTTCYSDSDNRTLKLNCKNEVANKKAPYYIQDQSIELQDSVLFAIPMCSDSSVFFSVLERQTEVNDYKAKKNTGSIVLLTLDKMVVNFHGLWSIEVLPMSEATILFSFLDYRTKHSFEAREGNTENYNEDNVLIKNKKNLALTVSNKYKSLLSIFVYELLKIEDVLFELLFDFFRKSENYWIVHFLLAQVLEEDNEKLNIKVGQASKKYGVSESYFRKLCHKTFARSPKKQIRFWRAAHSILELIEKGKPIVHIAGHNGYSSSSHFSSEIKFFFGLTPKEFKKLKGLLNE